MERLIWNTWRLSGCVLAIALFAGPVSAQAPAAKPEGAPAQSQQPEEAKPLPVPKVAAAVDPNTYKIGAGDVLDVRVWKEP